MKGRLREGLHPFSDDGNTPLCKSKPKRCNKFSQPVSKLGGVRRELSTCHAKVYGPVEMYCGI